MRACACVHLYAIAHVCMKGMMTEAQRRLTSTTQLQLPVSSMFKAYLRILDIICTRITHSTPQNVIYNQTNEKTALLLLSLSLSFVFIRHFSRLVFLVRFFPDCAAKKSISAFFFIVIFSTFLRMHSWSSTLSNPNLDSDFLTQLKCVHFILLRPIRSRPFFSGHSIHRICQYFKFWMDSTGI